MQYAFTDTITLMLKTEFGNEAEEILRSSQLLQYLNIKTRSANRSSKARGSYANVYAIYVLVEDYISKNYHNEGNYSQYKGATFTTLLKRQRELPFGTKLQNHALNSRMNEEFRRYFPQSEYIPILRDSKTNRYWINENLLKISVNNKVFNLASAIIKIIDRYIEAKKGSFDAFIQTCKDLQSIQTSEQAEVREFIENLLAPNVDARIFEIVSYAILKYYYYGQSIYLGFEVDKLQKEALKLYKTGRTNANDGGIDFVMKPLGRFFQVTETLDVRKYFLDIDKIEKYPITFVIKSEEDEAAIKNRIQQSAMRQYAVETIVANYMASIEEIINIPILLERFGTGVEQGRLANILDEIIRQSRVEFNYEDSK